MACLTRVVLDLVYRRLQVSAAPSLELDYRTGVRYVPHSGTYFFQGSRYYDLGAGRLMLGASTNVSTRFAEYRHSVPCNRSAV